MKLRGIFGLLCALLLTSTRGNAQEWNWVQRFQGDKSAATDVGIDAAENVYVAGTLSGTNSIGTNGLVSGDGTNLFIAKFDPFGQPLWSMTAGGVLAKMLVASNGSVFVCGNLVLRDAATSQSFSNVMLARLDEGNIVWTEPLPEGATNAGGMTFAPDETLYLIA